MNVGLLQGTCIRGGRSCLPALTAGQVSRPIKDNEARHWGLVWGIDYPDALRAPDLPHPHSPIL